MPGIRSCRSALVLLVGTLVVLPTAAYAQTTPAPAPPPATPPPTLPVGPAPFDMPMDSGPKMMAQAAQAQLDLTTIQPQLAAATAERDEAQTRWDQLTAHLVYLDGLRSQAIAELDAAKARLGASAARAYKESGGGRVNAALEAMREADDLLDMSRDLHLISTYGDYELDIVAGLEARKRDLDQEILTTSRERVNVKERLDAAVAQVTQLTAQVDDANRRLTEANDAMARFKLLATTAG